MVTIIVVAVVVVAVLVVAAIAWQAQRRRQSLQERFGPEYDRTVESTDSRRDAEKELADRAARRDELDIRDLTTTEARQYREEWFGIQQRFVDAPGEAVTAARTLVSCVMRDRGYPTDTADDRESMLSVDHTDVVDSYREAMAIEEQGRRTGVTTEDLRQAMQHYGALVDRLVPETPAIVDVRDNGRAYGDTPEPAPSSRARAPRVSARPGNPAGPAV